jgi:ABC-2 type transport system permease protein
MSSTVMTPLAQRLVAHLRLVSKPYLREPAFWIPTLILPTALFALFSMSVDNSKPEQVYPVFVGFATFAVTSIGFFQFGILVAAERASAWRSFLRTVPGTAIGVLVSETVAALVFALAAIVLMTVAATALTSIDLSGWRFLAMTGSLLLGAIPMCLLGVCIGYMTSSRAVIGIANLLLLVLSYVGGYFSSRSSMPDWLAALSPYVPTGAFRDMVFSAAMSQPLPATAVLILLLTSVLAVAYAAISYRRDESRVFG